MPETLVVLTIAGSDPSGGAGLQADLKTFSALGVYGAAVVSALTAQNTKGVQGTQLIDPEFIRLQLQSVFEDLPVAAVKTGMLGNAAIIATVAEVLEEQLGKDPNLRLVVDPVMVARGGDVLLDPKAIGVLRERLLPLASVCTPNRREAALLTGTTEANDVDSLRRSARALFELLEHRPVLVKGGSILPGGLDLLIDGHGEEFPLAISGAPIATRSTHGAGCTLAAALAALLALGHGLREASAGAKQYVYGAIENAPGLGEGHGPIAHDWMRRIGPETRIQP